MSKPCLQQVAWLFSSAVLMSPLVAQAQEPASSPDPGGVEAEPAPGSPQAVELARKHFHTALTSYRAGRYRAAVAELKLALVHDPDGKDLIFNLGQLHEKLGDLPAALGYFRRLSELEKNPVEKERVQAIVKRLEGARDQAERDHEESGTDLEARPVGPRRSRPAASSAADETPMGRLDGWVWGVGGAAGLALVVGVTFGIKAWMGHPGSDARTSSTASIDSLRADADQAENDARVADVALGLSLVGAAAATFLYFARSSEPGDQARLDSPLAVRF